MVLRYVVFALSGVGMRLTCRYTEIEYTSLKNIVKEVVWPIYSNMEESRMKMWSLFMLSRCCTVCRTYMEKVSSIVMSSRTVGLLCNA